MVGSLLSNLKKSLATNEDRHNYQLSLITCCLEIFIRAIWVSIGPVDMGKTNARRALLA